MQSFWTTESQIICCFKGCFERGKKQPVEPVKLTGIAHRNKRQAMEEESPERGEALWWITKDYLRYIFIGTKTVFGKSFSQ